MNYLFVTFLVWVSTVVADEVKRPVSERFAQRDSVSIPDFQKHVVPLLGRLGCNTAKCHGSFQGQGDLRLSLFGFDFQSDHSALQANASAQDGPRLNPAEPESSLIVLKPTDQIDHDGGERFEKDSWEHYLLLRWIESGANGVLKIESMPKEGSEIKTKEFVFFKDSVLPILEDHCYECHGFNSKKGNLSMTYREGFLTGGDSGPAIVPGNPEQSLLMDALGYLDEGLEMPPSGKIAEDKIAILEQWIQKGAQWPEGYHAMPGHTDQILVRLHHEPSEILFSTAEQTQQIRLIAEWEDGTREDVTCLARFQTNNDAVVRVSRDGLAISVGEGDTHIIAFYDNGVAAIPVMRPYTDPGFNDAKIPESPAALQLSEHPIDRFVGAKLDKLGLVPSILCSDAEFLRRVSIDMTGTLPTPEEVTTFLSDASNDKRIRKVDELLQRPTYAAWWSNKLCDFTGCNPKSISSLLEVAREEGYVKASEWYDWIYDRVERNEPYDRLVSGLMLADLSRLTNDMPWFWTRQSLQEPKDTAMSVAHAFLGIQLQCAECHKHPFDRWTQADFNAFARFFEPVTRTKRRSVFNEALELQLLRSNQVQLQPGDDPRKPVMNWMREPDNPWFARAFVNRVWAGYFPKGIVDPPDQFTPANPPSHPQLLDWLANGFVESGYDMKWLHRHIATSATYQRSWKPNETNRTDRRNFSRAIPRRLPAEVVYDAIKQVAAAPGEQGEVRVNLRRRASGHLSMRMAGTHAMKVFGKPDRSINCDCERVNEPTLLQSIFTQNDPLLRMRLADSGWIIEIEDAEETGEPLDTNHLIEQVWLRTVSRQPTRTDCERAFQHLDESPSVAEGIRDLLWAMVNSKEFLLNH
jgi:hypothetical protein